MTKVKKWQWYFLLIIIVLALLLKAYSYYYPKAEVVIGDQRLNVLVADNNRHFYKGLSNKKDLGKYHGMLFIFSSSDTHTMVMRDMLFPIDIIWLDNYKIVDIAPSVKPEADNLDLIEYRPRLKADMILELKAGFALKNKVKIGDNVTILR